MTTLSPRGELEQLALDTLSDNAYRVLMIFILAGLPVGTVFDYRPLVKSVFQQIQKRDADVVQALGELRRAGFITSHPKLFTYSLVAEKLPATGLWAYHDRHPPLDTTETTPRSSVEQNADVGENVTDATDVVPPRPADETTQPPNLGDVGDVDGPEKPRKRTRTRGATAAG